MRSPWLDKSLWQTGLRSRLTLWNTAVVLLMTMASLAAARLAARAAIYDQADAELRSAASEIAFSLRDLFPDIDGVVAATSRKAESHEWRGWFVHLLTEGGQTIWQSDHCPEEVAHFPPHNLNHEENVGQVGPYRYVRRRIALAGQPTYHVRVGTYTTGLDASLSGLVRLLVAVGVVLCVLTPLAGWWLARRATLPVATMLETADKLLPTRLGDRLTVRGTGDELDRLAATINRLLDQVAEHVDLQQHFVADAAHELRGPLTAMQAALEVAISRDRDARDYRDALTEVLEETRSLTALANGLLTLAATVPKSAELVRTPVDVAALGRQAAAMFAGVAEDRGLTLRVEADDGGTVQGDPAQLRQVIGNLLDNALRFTPSGGGVRLSVERSAAANEVVVSVTDTGLGIPAEHLPRIFERFFKVDQARTRECGGRSGGLGLAICKSIVEVHDGRISILSRHGHGTTVTVRLPAATVPTETAAPCPARA